MAAAKQAPVLPRPEPKAPTTLPELYDGFRSGKIKTGSIFRIVGPDYDGIERDITLSINLIESGGGYYRVGGTNIADLRRSTNYYYRSAAKVLPAEVTPENKLIARISPLALELIPMRYHATIGADPEVFVVHGDGELFPSFEFLGSKKKPTRGGDGESTRAHAYWDGYQAEFSFIHPPTCMDGLVGDIQIGLRTVLRAAQAKDPKARLSVATTMDIPRSRRETDAPEYVAFGCTPSLNVYEDEKIDLPDGIDCPFRSSGGHLHFTFGTGANDKRIPDVIKLLDKVLGVIGVAMFQYYDDPRRRSLYGRAGEHRLPKYGFEYRVLSSAWMMHPGIVQFVYEMARTLIGCVDKGKGSTWWDATEDEVRRCINNCDVGLAHHLIDRNRDALMSLLMAMPRQHGTGIDAVQRLIDGPIKHGAHTAYANPDQFSNDWNLLVGWPQRRNWSGTFSAFAKTGTFDGG